MRKILLLMSAIMMSCVVYSQNVQQAQLQLHSFKESRSANGLANLGTLFQEGWPKDANGDKDCAWIRVRFENMPMEDAGNVDFNFGNSAPLVEKRNRLKEEEHEVWLFVTPTKSAIMEAKLDKYGTSNRLSNIQLEPKHAYDVVLKNDKTISINVITQPKGAIATLETGDRAETPATFTNVALGEHTLTISYDGKTLKEELIEVTESNVKFEYDLRPEKEITFASDPSGATLFLNGEEIGKTPMTVKLRYDSYNVEARLSLNETDSRAFTVSELSEDEIILEPVRKKTFEVFATYNGRKVDADLYIDGRQEGSHQSSYTLTRPIGKSYEMNMIYYGNSKKRKIRITKDMDIEQEFKISARNSFVWPWQREYDACPVGFSMGYVTKQWVTKGEGEMYKENVWGEENKKLHGLQIGLHLQPCFSWGLGLYTGLFYEYYMSWSDEMKDNGYMDKFQEHCAYVPVHVYYRLPFAKKFALSVHGGVGMDCGIYAIFSSTEDDNVEPVTDYYGEEGWPNRFNLSAEVGVGLRMGPVQLKGQYSKGLTDHKFYTDLGDYKTIQKKLSLSISWVFSSSN